MTLLERVPATLLVLLAVVSINLGSAVAQLMDFKTTLAVALISLAAIVTSLVPASAKTVSID